MAYPQNLLCPSLTAPVVILTAKTTFPPLILIPNLCNNHNQLIANKHICYLNAFKFRVEGHSGSQVPIPELELCPQPLITPTPSVLSLG